MKRLAILLVLAALPASAQISIKGGGGSSGGSISTPVSIANGGTGNANGDGLLATCTDSVGTDAYACSSTSTPGCPASLAASEPVLFVAGTANTGGATFDYCSLGAKALVKTIGGISTALATGDILAKQPVLVRYNATDDNWKMISAVSTAPAGSLAVGGAITSGTATRFLYEDGSNQLAESAAAVIASSGAVTLGTGLSGTAVPLTTTNGTSTGNSLTVLDGATQSFVVRDGGDIQCLTSGLNRCIFHYGGAAAGYGFATGFEGASTNSMYTRVGLYTGADSTWTWYDVSANFSAFGFSRGPNNIGSSSARATEIRANADYDLKQWGTTATGIWSRDFVKNAPTTLTAATATTVATISVASGDHGGGVIEYEVYAEDGTDLQSRSGSAVFNVVNKAGTETCTVYGRDITATGIAGPTANPDETQDGSGGGAISSGTLTYGWTVDTTGANQCLLKLNAVSSLAETVLQVTWRVRANGKLTIN